MAFALFRRPAPEKAPDSQPAAANPAVAALSAQPTDDASKAILDLLQLELGTMIRQLERAADSVVAGAQSAAETLATIRTRTESLTGRSSEAQSTAATFSQAADKFTQSAEGIGSQVRDASKLADDASAAAREASANVDRLRDSSAAIGNVVNLIATIAKQTTLLALNSTIEAARAGEAGKGFAVVASEVKALAVQTQNATEEIRRKIDALQQDAASSIDAVHRISKAIDAIRPVFETVNGAVAEQGATTGEMASNAAAASSFITSVGDGANEIDSATREAEAHGASVAEAGQAVTTFAGKLKARCAVLLRQDPNAAVARLPCKLAIELKPPHKPAITGDVFEISPQGILIVAPGVGSLAPKQTIDATLADIGDCRISIVGHNAVGTEAAFASPDKALANRIEDKVWSIQDSNTEDVMQAMEAGEALNRIFNDAVARGDITIDDLFDETYVEIEGTNPVQYRTKFLDWADRALPALQEAFAAKNTRVAFASCIDRNGYLPVHNKMYSHPQRPGDVAWNTANSRNRRIFNDAAGLAAGRNTRAYLVQTYARDMGNGQKVMMREIDVPISVGGRHWGGLRTAYRL
ncbi:MAG: methyl-accepting chemotaxis protein [Pseudomonadota bacterium]